jgi:hypothetical protein
VATRNGGAYADGDYNPIKKMKKKMWSGYVNLFPQGVGRRGVRALGQRATHLCSAVAKSGAAGRWGIRALGCSQSLAALPPDVRTPRTVQACGAEGVRASSAAATLNAVTPAALHNENEQGGESGQRSNADGRCVRREPSGGDDGERQRATAMVLTANAARIRCCC